MHLVQRIFSIVVRPVKHRISVGQKRQILSTPFLRERIGRSQATPPFPAHRRSENQELKQKMPLKQTSTKQADARKEIAGQVGSGG